MKFYIALFALLALSQAEEVKPKLGFPMLGKINFGGKDSRVLEEPIGNLINCVIQLLLNGDPDLGIPSFNPLQITNLTLTSDELGISDVINGFVQLTNGELEAINNLSYDNLVGTVHILPPSFDIVLDLVVSRAVASTQYNVNLQVPSIEFDTWGEGSLNLELSGLSIHVELTLNILSGSVTTLNIVPSLQSLDAFSVTGIRGDEEYSSLVSQHIIDNIDQVVQELTEVLAQVTDAILNSEGGGLPEGGVVDQIISQCLSSRTISGKLFL